MIELASIFNELGQGKAALKVLEPIASEATRDEALLIAHAYYEQRKYQSTLDYLAAHKQRLNLSNDAAAKILEAQSLLQLGRLAEAESKLNQLDATNIQVALEKIALATQRNEQPQAIAAMASLVEQHPENISVLLAAAQQAEQTGQLEKAEDLLSKALVQAPETDILMPQKIEILRRLSTTLTKLGRSNEALIYAKTLTEANPQGSLLQDKFKQGLELFQAGKFEEAEPILAEIYKESKNETAGMLLGMIHYARNDMRGAEQYLGSNVDPEVAPEAALTTLAATQLRLNQPDKLLALFDKNARDTIKSPELKLMVGIALLQTGDTAQGETLINAAQALRPNDLNMLSTLVRYYLSTGNTDKAIAQLQATDISKDETMSRLLVATYLMAKRPDDALEAAKNIANTAPPKAENIWVLGHTALQLQRPDIAGPALEKALTLTPGFLPARLDLANLQLRRKQYAEAQKSFIAILREKPDALPALRGLLIAINQEGVEEKELEQRFLSETKNSETSKLSLAEYYLATRKLDDAERIVNAISSEEPSTRLNQIRQQLTIARTMAALQTKNYQQARNFAAEGLESFPLNPTLLTLLARIDLQENKIDDARKIAAQLQQVSPQSPQTQELLGDIASLAKDPAAKSHYRNAWNKLANDSLGLKLYQSLAATPADARAFLDEWSKRLPGSMQVQLLSGLSKQQAGDNKGAIAEYEAVIARDERNALALNNLAWLYSEMGDKRALPTAERAMALQQDNPAVLDTYGWILVQSGQKERGIAQLEKALKLAPDSKEIKQHLTQAQSR